ncbi:MAG: cyclic nucleotide-binding domain-containing protein [Planctomycetota bacterium]
MGVAKNSIKIIDLIPGSHLVQIEKFSILVGMPPEVVKSLREKSLPIPQVWLLPDQYLVGGVSRLSVEFPFYYSVFFSGLLQRGERIKLIGTSKQIQDCMDILRLGLLGLNEAEYQEARISRKVWEHQLREIEWLALKDANGNVRTVDSFFEKIPFSENSKIQFEGIEIQKGDFDLHIFSYQGDTRSLHYLAREKILPSYFNQLPPNINLLPYPRFGVHFLGSATGFSNAPSSGMIIQHGCRMILVDAIPYACELLELRGLHRNQISALILTHNHDDHAGGLSEFLFADHRVTLLTTPEIHYQMMKRLSIYTGESIKNVSKYFKFYPLVPGHSFRYYGLEILPHYTIHTIPTIGIEFIYHSLDTVKTIRVMGDQNSLDNIRKMREDGIISEKRFLTQLALFNDPTDLLIGDVGQGVVHGNPKDYEHSLAKKVVFMHQDSLPDQYICRYSLAQPGYCFELVKGSPQNDLLIAAKALQSNFPIHHFDWMDTLLGSCEFRTYNPGEVVLRQHESSDSVFLVLQGQLEFYIDVEGQKPKKIAYAHSGDLFGEMSIVTGQERRNASVVAHSSVRLAELNGRIFYEFIEDQKLKNTLLATWEKRAVVQGIKIFEGLSLSAIYRIARISREIDILSQQVIFSKETKCRDLYLIKKGEVLVHSEVHENLTPTKILLRQSDYFGYLGETFCPPLTASTETDTSLLILSWKHLKEIANDVPLLQYRLNLTATSKPTSK